MNGKITLITPPDFFENSNLSLLFIHVQDNDQIKISEWFGRSNISRNINIYFFNDETNAEWLLYAVNRCEFKFINFDYTTNLTAILSGHFLSKSNFYYKTEDVNTAQICQYLNNNRITNIEDFLEKALNGKKRDQAQL